MSKLKPTLPPLVHPMDEYTESRLCAVYQVESVDQLDSRVIDAYRTMRIVTERITSTTGADAFLYAIIATSGVPIPEPKVTFYDYVKEGLVSLDDALLVKLRANKWEPAKYRGARKGKIIVDLDGTEYTLDPELVKFSEEVEPIPA